MRPRHPLRPGAAVASRIAASGPGVAYGLVAYGTLAFGAIAFGTMALGALPAARADTPPAVWEMARTPGLRQAWRLHLTVRELLDLEPSLEDRRSGAVEQARVLLEAARADTSPHAFLRFDLAEVYERLEAHERVIGLLKPTLAAYPEAPMASEGYRMLAFAYAKLGRSREERDAYVQHLARETDERHRATALLNLAEAHMHLGDLPEAVDTYREAVRVAASVPLLNATEETGILAQWGLAVALHRAGDPVGALDAARQALARDPREGLLRNRDRVFFVPAYEENWYYAVAAMARARDASDPRIAARHFAAAATYFQTYSAHAHSEDRWLPAARAYRDQNLSASKAAAARGAKLQRPGPLLPEPLDVPY